MLKVIGLDLLPAGLRYATRFGLAAEAGFTHVEMRTVTESAEADEVGEAAASAGLTIHSVVAYANGRPLTFSGGAEERAGIVEAAAATIANAARWGAETVLLVPGLVDARTSYEQAAERSHAAIRTEVLPLAESAGVILGLENVWYGFLLGPLEYARYVDSFASPRVRAYLDIGNMIFGHPHHWVRTLGARVASVHFKGFAMDPWGGRFRFTRPGQGDIDWVELRRAFREVGYAGGITTTGVPRGGLISRIDRARRILGPVTDTRRPGRGNVLGALERRAYLAFLRDLGARFERFESLA